MEWEKKKVQFKFRLGEFNLFNMDLSAFVCNSYFTDIRQEDSTQIVREFLSRSEVHGAIIRSCPVRKDLPLIRLERGYIQYAPYHYERYFVDIEGSFDEYLKKFRHKSRSTRLRQAKKFKEFSGGKIEWKEYRYPDEIETFYQFARGISETTYQERLVGCALPKDEAFRKDLRNLAETDSIRGYVLFHKEIPIAYLMSSIIKDSTMLLRYIGFNPTYKQYSPGTILQYLVLQRLFSEGKMRVFDFTEGEGQYKKYFSNNSKRCADIYFFKLSLSNILIIIVHSSLARISRFIVKILDILKLKSRIKKAIRSHA
ncbi:MAG: GNAT family N-acetyltransferase [Candidatus Omnitrophica bacterium]|nr:GNAT family N-acetyltransferase [Candidatus Omnitrophota bacterium]